VRLSGCHSKSGVQIFATKKFAPDRLIRANVSEPVRIKMVGLVATDCSVANVSDGSRGVARGFGDVGDFVSCLKDVHVGSKTPSLVDDA